MDRAYRASTRAVGAVMFVLGVLMIATTIARGGGPLAVGVIAGVLFAALGAIRYLHATRAGS